MSEENAEDILPEWLLERIERGRREGVSFSIARRGDGWVTAIHWRAGDRNALAESIIKHVTHEKMLLFLNQQKFMIRKVDPREHL